MYVRGRRERAELLGEQLGVLRTAKPDIDLIWSRRPTGKPHRQ